MTNGHVRMRGLYLPGGENVFIERESPELRPASPPNTIFLGWLIFVKYTTHFHVRTNAAFSKRQESVHQASGPETASCFCYKHHLLDQLPCENGGWYLPSGKNVMIERAGLKLRPASAINTSFST